MMTTGGEYGKAMGATTRPSWVDSLVALGKNRGRRRVASPRAVVAGADTPSSMPSRHEMMELLSGKRDRS